MIPLLSHFLPSLSLLNDSHFPRTVSVLQFTVRFTAYREKLFKWFNLMLSYAPLLFYFCQDTDLLSVLMVTVCCQANSWVVRVKRMLPVRQLTFSRKDETTFFSSGSGEEEGDICFRYGLFLQRKWLSDANSDCSETTPSLTPLAASRSGFIYFSGAALGLKAFYCLPELVFS